MAQSPTADVMDEARTEELVEWHNRCPKCDEQRMDYLVWEGDYETGEVVVCYTCGNRYTP